MFVSKGAMSPNLTVNQAAIHAFIAEVCWVHRSEFLPRIGVQIYLLDRPRFPFLSSGATSLRWVDLGFDLGMILLLIPCTPLVLNFAPHT